MTISPLPAGWLVLALLAATCCLVQADGLPLLQPGKATLGWTFDRGQEFPGAQGRLSIAATQEHGGSPSLELEGDFTQGGAYVRANTPVADIGAGELTMWVKSPDTDRLTLRLLDATGQCHQITFKLEGGGDWQKFDFNLRAFFAKAEDPAGTAVIHYESWGGAADQKWHGPLKSLDILVSPTDAKKVVTVWIDDVVLHTAAAAPDAAATGAGGARISFATARLGNLLFPQDPRRFLAMVESGSRLDPRQLRLTCVVRDYDGAEQTAPQTVALVPVAGTAGHNSYQATIDLAGASLETGRYYELDASVPRMQGEPYRDHTSFALLPEAAGNAYPAADIPFSSRDWDNRLTDYFLLSHRLGIRLCGVWSGWDAARPDQPYAPGIDLCAKLGMGVIASTPVHDIEEHLPGYEKYTEPVLRAGARSLIAKYGKTTHPFILSLGNEPHGTGDRVTEDVRAYAAVYDEVKKTDPSILVLGTSVGPDDEFFRDGMGRYCDAYDFHAYEEAPHIAKIFQEYRTLFQKYGDAKPIWSTELGLDSQGVSRRDVAVDMIKKFALFFANGGVNLSWFDLLYPDPDGSAADSAGAAHNVFDSRYGRYAPKLTAVIYYDLVNTILDKKFVAERSYGDVHLYLFRDLLGRGLIIGWKDSGRQDARLPLPGAGRVEIIHADSRRRDLDAASGAITLTFSTDPLLVTFAGGAPLPVALGKPAISFAAVPEALTTGLPATVSLSSDGAKGAKVRLGLPPFWRTSPTSVTAAALSYSVTPPAGSAAREADLAGVISDAHGDVTGEIDLRLPLRQAVPEPSRPAAGIP
jgi:hypothetical protein